MQPPFYYFFDFLVLTFITLKFISLNSSFSRDLINFELTIQLCKMFIFLIKILCIS